MKMVTDGLGLHNILPIAIECQKKTFIMELQNFQNWILQILGNKSIYRQQSGWRDILQSVVIIIKRKDVKQKLDHLVSFCFVKDIEKIPLILVRKRVNAKLKSGLSVKSNSNEIGDRQ